MHSIPARKRSVFDASSEWIPATTTLVGVGLFLGRLWDGRPLAGAGLSVDRVGAVAFLAVAAIGWAVHRHAARLLDGNPLRSRFLRRLTATLVAAEVLTLAVNLPLLWAAWSAAGFGLHLLLTNDPTRTESFRPARKKFLISRIGDVALVAALILVARHWDTFDLNTFLERSRGEVGGPSTAVALLVVIAALTKSAQFPFHSWLPETMEAPTPVSALMHAGLINAGGFLLIRFAPLISRVPAAWSTLSAIGALTLAVGTTATWAQVKVKRALAWSTVAQMGFMMVQLGIGAFASALLHIVGHGCYKAWSFLSAGEVGDSRSEARRSEPLAHLAKVGIGFLAAGPSIAAAAWATGFDPTHAPGEVGLCLVLALAVGQLWAAEGGSIRSLPKRAPGLAAASTLLLLLAFGLYRGVAWYLAPLLNDCATPTGWAAWTAAALPVFVLAGLTVLHAFLPILANHPVGFAFRVHAMQGFYFGAAADRLVDRVWCSEEPKGVARA